jgi:hypothetical protein
MVENGNNTFDYKIPAYSSPEGRKVQVLFQSGVKKFMTYNDTTNTLSLNPGDDDSGNYILIIKLIDDKG